MKKVLIICDLFPPAFGPRMGYLCKYMKTLDWEPTVLTEYVRDEHAFRFLANECETAYVDFYPIQKKWFRKLKWIIVFLLDFCFGYKDRKIYKAAEKLKTINSFDIILCSTYRTFPLLAAKKIAQAYRMPLVVDLRDMIEQYTGNEFIAHSIPHFFGLEKLLLALFKRKNIDIRNRILKTANHLTTVSPWHAKLLSTYNPNVSLIYNGFDPELFYPENKASKQFIISYTGRLLSIAMSDPRLLLESLAKLSSETAFTPQECKVHWYVNPASWKIVQHEAEKAGVSSFMEYKGYIPAPEIPKILHNSSILLLLTNRSDDVGPKGIMTTKFFESLAIQKPILCVRSDESYLAEAIRDTKAGIAATSVDEVCDFLRFHHKEWKKNGYTSSATDKDKLRVYSRKEQAKQFVHIFDKVLTKEQIS